jgi:hypothetical protein
MASNPVRRAAAELAGLYANGQTPDDESVADAYRKLHTSKVDRAIRDAGAYRPFHPAQVEYLKGLLADLLGEA